MIMKNYIHDILNEVFFNYYEDRTRHNNFLINYVRKTGRLQDGRVRINISGFLRYQNW